MPLSPGLVQRFSRAWRVEAAYKALGAGLPVLLPAFSAVSSREDMRPLASPR